MNGVYLASTEMNDNAFVINIPQMKFGIGVSQELPYEAKRLGMKNCLLVVGKRLSETKAFEEIKYSLENNDIKVHVTTHVRIEPEDTDLIKAYEEIKELKIDGFIALGGGSTMDTAKVLNLLYSDPRDIYDYTSKPIGKGLSPSVPLKPYIAVPTTGGTGSEMTGNAMFDVTKLKVKAGIRNPYLKPTLALVDPLLTITQPPMVTASTGLDVLSHAIESYTSPPYTAREKPKSPDDRPVYVGSTPISDIFGKEIVSWVHKYLTRAAGTSFDLEARYYMSLGASLAGLILGHSGVHILHSMSYAIATTVKEWHPEDYEFGYPIVPHGISTAIPAPYALKYIVPYAHEKFGELAEVLNVGHKGMDVKELSESIFEYYIKLLEWLKVPTTLRDIGFTNNDLDKLVEGTIVQPNLSRSPKKINKKDLEIMFKEML